MRRSNSRVLDDRSDFSGETKNHALFGDAGRNLITQSHTPIYNFRR
jgi:hypothetical protein